LVHFLLTSYNYSHSRDNGQTLKTLGIISVIVGGPTFLIGAGTMMASFDGPSGSDKGAKVGGMTMAIGGLLLVGGIVLIVTGASQ